MTHGEILLCLQQFLGVQVSGVLLLEFVFLAPLSLEPLNLWVLCLGLGPWIMDPNPEPRQMITLNSEVQLTQQLRANMTVICILSRVTLPRSAGAALYSNSCP